MCNLKKIKNKIVIQSARHISINVQLACHTVYHVSKYAQSYVGGVIFRIFFLHKDANQTENFTGAKTENDLYYRGEKHY